MASRKEVAARSKAREARARLEAERKAHEDAVDARVADYVLRAEEVREAEEALAAAQEAVRLRIADRRVALGGVIDLERDLAVVRALTGATQADVTEARRELRSRVGAASPDEGGEG
ncbi:MAG: hypothetical protein Q4G34_01095 [Micrococcus sp.]|nr:hypothetical protein [Micrococcus sp.]